MKCDKVQNRLAGYLDDALASAPRLEERSAIRQHLDACMECREELQRYRKLSVLLSRMPRAVPPADLAVKIKVAAAQAQNTKDWPSRWQHIKDRAEILLDNTFRPLTVPATWRAPPAMPASEFATAMPRSLWQWTENTALSEFGTRSIRVRMKWVYSSGTV